MLVFRVGHHPDAKHIPGKLNGPADALSRNNPHSFLSQVTYAKDHPAGVPSELVELLMTHHPDWTSTNWTALWGNISQKV